MTCDVIHVRCTPSGTWVVRVDGCDDPCSEHATETEAERAASKLALVHDAASVIVHDRYGRTHGPHMRWLPPADACGHPHGGTLPHGPER